MNLLIIGGTQFVGRALTAEALKRGYSVTLFNRGKTNPDLFPEAEKIAGDRDGDLSELEARQWDAVIDTCGYVPRIVTLSAEKLYEKVERYVFVSTISVYASLRQPGVNEESPLNRELADELTEEVNGETYGPLKVRCEEVVEQRYGERSLIIRPGLITGPHDHTDRFAYWPVRVAKGGDVLAPSLPERPIQHIDARDLANFILNQTEKGASGHFNATGPAYEQTMGELIETTLGVSQSDASVTWVDDQFLLDNEVSPFTELPFWLPIMAPDYVGFMRVDCSKGIAAGLTFRPLKETVADTIAWNETRVDHVWTNTISEEKEREVLAAWRAREEESDS
ncbi:MAG: epimerase [Chloroflexota bacterium]